MLAPTMYKNVPCRNYVRSTVLNNARKSDELNTTVDRPTTNENDTACLRNVEDTSKGIFHKNIKKLDSSSRVNFADSSCVKTPELVTLRDPPVDKYDVPDNAGVAAGISDEDRIWFAKLREIGGTAATHDDLKQTSETLKFKQLVKNIDFETFKTLERENIERENIFPLNFISLYILSL